MTAGVDLDGWRELAATVRRASWEAQASLSVSGTPAPSGGSLVAVQPMLLGPSRVVRPFTLHAGGAEGPEPEAMLLAALAADAAAIAALSLRLQKALAIRIGVRAYAGAEHRLGLELDAAGHMTATHLAVAAEHIRQFCVVYRTLAEPAVPRLLTVTPRESRALTVTDGSHPAGGEAYAVWQDGSRSTVTTAGHTLVADRPKQLFGGDRAPSPEEYLIAALAAEALPGDGAEVHVSARLDLRGALGFEGVPVGLRDLLVQCLVPAGGAAEPVGGPVLGLLRRSNDIDVTVRLDSLCSTHDELEKSDAP